MSQNTEQTEAKLAAYIDGTLDPADRAEIEKYLASNPEHRNLIAELTAQRDALRNLPRAKAPADVYDSVQAQLERAILLDDSAAAAIPITRRSRRPQLMAVAAMLFLALGLGAVLYFVLPSSQPRPTEVAIGDRAREVTSSPTTTFDTTETTGSPLPDRRAVAEEGTAAAPPAAGKSATSALAEGPTFESRNNVVSNFSTPSPLQETIALNGELNAAAGKQKLANQAAAATPEQPVVLLVSTNNPDQARQQVETFLESNKLTFTAAGDHGPRAYFGAIQADADAEKSKDAPPAAASAQPEGNPTAQPAPDADRTSANRDFAKKESKAVAEDKTDNFHRRAADQARLKAGESEVAGGLDVSAGAAGRGAQSAQVQQQAQQPHENLSLQRSAQAIAAAPPQQRLNDLSQQQIVRGLTQSAATSPAYNGRVIARSVMTRRQAYQLASTLSNDRPGQVARLLDEQPATALGVLSLNSASQQNLAYNYTTTAPAQFDSKNYSQLLKQLPELSPSTSSAARIGDDEQRAEPAAPNYSFELDGLATTTTAPGAQPATPTTHDSQSFAGAGPLTITNLAGTVTPATEPAVTPLADDAVDVLIMVQDQPTTTTPSQVVQEPSETPTPSKIAPYPAKARASDPRE